MTYPPTLNFATFFRSAGTSCGIRQWKKNNPRFSDADPESGWPHDQTAASTKACVRGDFPLHDDAFDFFDFPEKNQKFAR
jgi:hypothetical protein